MKDRRTMRGVLDSRRFAEADLRMLEVVGAFGLAHLVVKNPGGEQQFIVANQSGQTFAPGAQVLGASTTGMPGEAVLGGAPGGKQGSGSRRPNRRQRPQDATANQYAFGPTDTGFAAFAYLDGALALVRAETVEIDAEPCGCILYDSSGLVGAGSMLGRYGFGFQVWGVVSNTAYS